MSNLNSSTAPKTQLLNGKLAMLIAVLLIGFAIGFIHQHYIYPIYFHGDSAAMQVLARAIVEKHSLLPKDFSYGNQIIFLRSSYFIALVMLLGMSGYKAYIVGSALSIAFWFVITYLALSSVFPRRSKALALAVALFIPLGYNDLDMVLGQQSHLANIVLALVAAIMAFQASQRPCRRYLILSFLPIALMALEAPIRGALVALPLIVVLFICFGVRRSIYPSALSLAGIIVGFVGNALLLRHTGPLEVNYLQSLTLYNLPAVMANLSQLVIVLLSSTMATDVFAGMKIVSVGFLLYILSIGILLCYVAAFIYGIVRATERVRVKLAAVNDNEPSLLDFFFILAAIGIVIGLFAVASLNPDSPRHVQWAMSLLKITLFLWLYEQLSRIIKTKSTLAIITIIVALLTSCWYPVVSNKHLSLSIHITFHRNRDFNREILTLMRQNNIYQIYSADFWGILPLNAIDNRVNAGELAMNGDNFVPRHWLSRPSWFCATGEVFYYLNQDVEADRLIKDRIVKRHGELLLTKGDVSIWKGPVIWENDRQCVN
ncbi:Putative membrane protein [Sodalis praecaptivus]|uniref:Putative membrane protein n=1 Tax=Sodalis praecaptivus TaxID=1239307 RepID=W0HR92_9GAMM|nr:hypothetical protein [Sodalis praecaptivus]AHF76361.1 Putative membrane protein [Sodalis praecaptivus]